MNLYNQDIGMFEMPCCEEPVQENLSQKPYPVITPFSLRKGELISWEYKIQAELYRVKKAFDKAEPLYLEAINILEESFGLDDIRVGAALHNLGQFYLVQRKLEEARNCYQRALKIKRHVLGEGHTDYADTMFHLGTVVL
ncbi:unnamed protein product [Ilex paraguariensis]|uniref:Kinesin light chain n=1 Tax=Ilex paraguariensis TaxID=185542 RepID=A0ABC8TK46_9AQUA